MDPLSVASFTATALGVLCKFMVLCKKMYDIPDDVRIFMRLLDRIQQDYRYAISCRTLVRHDLERVNKFHRLWVAEVFGSITEEIIAVDQYLPDFTRCSEGGAEEPRSDEDGDSGVDQALHYGDERGGPKASATRVCSYGDAHESYDRGQLHAEY